MKKIPRGIIVSIQGYGRQTIQELAKEAESAGAVALRTDKPINTDLPLIGLNKTKVNHPSKEAYITITLEQIERVAKWADYVAIDLRRCNQKIKEINDFCIENKINVVADIACFDDYLNLKEMGVEYSYIATTLRVFKKRFGPDLGFLKRVVGSEKMVIAEGNYSKRNDVKAAYELGALNVCIGTAISGTYKLTRKYTTIGY